MGVNTDYEMLFLASGHAIVKVDEMFSVIESNNTFSKNFDESGIKEDIISLQKHKEHLLKGENYLSEGIRFDKMGNGHDVVITYIPIIREKTFRGAFVIYKDITKEKCATLELKRQMMIFESLFKNSSDAIVRIDKEQRIIEVNENFENFFGYSFDEIKGKTTDRLISKDDELQHNTDLTLTLLKGEKVVVEGKRYAKDGSAKDYLVQGVPIVLEGEVIGGYGIFTSVHALKEATKKIAAQKVIFEALFKNSSDAIIRFDTEHNIIEINENFTTLFGYVLEEIANKKLDDILISNGGGEQTVELTKRVLNGERIIFEGPRKGKYDQYVFAQIKGVPIIEDGVVIGGYGIYTNITEKKRAEEKILYISYHDQLTGMYNRRFIEEKMAEFDQNRAMPVALIMADVNGLKLTNDAFGHHVGDALLKKMGEILEMHCREGDFLARLGGDEFVILMPNTRASQAEQIVHQIMETCNDAQFNNLNISMSFGSDARIEPDEPMSILFNRVENYMYRHKLIESPSFRGRMFETIIKTLHEKNKREERHSSRVSLYCEAIGNAMRLSKREIQDLKTAGWLHDIGKIAISESILNKEGKLTRDEWESVKKHPEIGYRILSSVNEMSDLANCVLAHHERFDGLGYPKALKGEEIPLMARIITVADAFDAMTTARTYRHIRTKEEAIDELLSHAGTQFDPAIVDIFVNHVLKQLIEA